MAAAVEDDESWVFDSLVCFLNGPIWNAPLQSFIEERSLIFEPNVTENADYRKIYDEFRNLVDCMLGNFMEDIGITPQQFEDACHKGARDGVPLHFDQGIFEQIWAANDYEMFKRMMTQRNVELQLQALELIEQKYGRTPQIFMPKKNDELENESGETTVEISPVPLHKSSDLEREILEEVSKQFVEEHSGGNEPEQGALMEEKLNLEETLKKAIESKLNTQKLILEQEIEENETDEVVEEHIKPVIERISIDRPQNTVDNAEIKKRQEYLRTQRDKLVAMKKEVRKKQFDDDNSMPGKSRMLRPKSAKAAEDSLNGESGGGGRGGSENAVENQQMKLRKALVRRLKSEVMGGGGGSQH